MRQNAFARLSHKNPGPSQDDIAGLHAETARPDPVLGVLRRSGLLPAETIARHTSTATLTNRDPSGRIPRAFPGDQRRKCSAEHPAYNGGLFAPDPALDRTASARRRFAATSANWGNTTIAQPAKSPRTAGEDQGHLVDVDILGHIFEQSITDLERIRNELDERAETAGAEKHKSRRKKEGAFYTPAFITRYIVEQALGGVLEGPI